MTVVAVLTLAGAGLIPAASASALPSAKTVTIKVVGISRTGAQVTAFTNVVPPHGNSIPSTGHRYRLNPSSGFVTLRTVTVNTRGNSSTETIYRAYGVR